MKDSSYEYRGWPDSWKELPSDDPMRKMREAQDSCAHPSWELAAKPVEAGEIQSECCRECSLYRIPLRIEAAA